MKVCTRCEIEKDENEFYKQPACKGRKERRQSICKDCIKKRRLAKYSDDPEYRRRKIEIASKWQKDNPEKAKNKNLIWHYGISLERYNELFQEQGEVCAICNKAETRKSRSGGICMLHVDHNHSTGEVRGLLCFMCNAALGGFREDVEVLNKAIQYLVKHNISHLQTSGE